MRSDTIEEALEYDIQEYVAENFRKLGFTSVKGPFPVGPDFEGEIDGAETMVEVERGSKDYLTHGHQRNPEYASVGVLVILNGTKPRGVLRSLLPPRIVAIDKQDFRKWLDHKRELAERKENLLRKQFEGIEVRLEKDGEVYFSTSSFDPESDFEDVDLERLAGYYSLIANSKRFRVMQELLKRRSMRFSDLLEITGNPKLVGDCVNPLIERGMLVHDYDHNYRITARGEVISNYLIGALPLVHSFLNALEKEALDGLEDEDLE